MRWRDNSWISHKYIVVHKFVKDYVDHLAQIEMHKEKRRAESERQQTQWLEQDYNDIEWEQYCIILTTYQHWKIVNFFDLYGP